MPFMVQETHASGKLSNHGTFNSLADAQYELDSLLYMGGFGKLEIIRY